MKINSQIIIYWLGLAVLGLFFYPIRVALGGKWLFLFSAIAYLFALRFLGALVAKLIARKKAEQ
jgi:hypothetical protein